MDVNRRGNPMDRPIEAKTKKGKVWQQNPSKKIKW